MRYYYVVYGSDASYYLESYKQLFDNDNSRYIYNPINSNNKLLNFLYRVHNSEQINSHVRIPFKNWWNSRIDFANDLKEKEKICFLFFAGTRRFASINNGFASYLRKKYSGCKLVCFYQDLVNIKRSVTIETAKKIFDLIISFDPDDCAKYGLVYHPLVYTIKPYKNILPKNDVFFVGQAKNRMSEIICTYEYLVSKGLKCDFNIVGANENERKHAGQITYLDGMSYQENILHILNSKAILEIMQQGGAGFTLRTCEAIAYDRLLITNNKRIKEAPFFNDAYIEQFSDPIQIDVMKIKNTIPPCNYNYKEMLNPICLLDFIDNLL